MTSLLSYEVVDVFTDRPFAGNPLAVVLDADALSTEQLQAIAREFNLSETAFPMAASDGADYRLRIFTPQQELPFAGHPSLGAAEVLQRLGRIQAGRVTMSCGAGLLPLDVQPGWVTLTGGAPSWSDEIPAEGLLAALGLSAVDGTGPARRVGCGIDFHVVPVTRSALARIRPDLGAVAAYGGAGVSAFCWDGSVAWTRVFAAGAGVPEDPATGSAALGLGLHLVLSGALGADGQQHYQVVQGVEMGRASFLRCTVDAEAGRPLRAQVSGSIAPVARGEIRIPAG